MFDFDDQVLEAEEELHGPPYLVCWYSGGFRRPDGLELVAPLLEAAKKTGIVDHLVLDHPNEYGMTGEGFMGYEPYPAYVDRLIEEIDKVAAGRPLILFGHSRGCCPSAAVATRLGSRVLACYFVGSQGSIVPGRKTPWERLCRRFTICGEQSMLSFFAEMQPGNFFLQRAAKSDREELEAMKESSKFFASMVELMAEQYIHCMHPDMSLGVIDRFPADVVAVSPVDDASCSPESLEEYAKLTSGEFELMVVDGGHMGCLKPPVGSETCDLHTKVLRSMLARWKSDPLEDWRKQLGTLQQDLIFGRLFVRTEPGTGDAARALQKCHHWVARNPWATEEEVRAQKKELQRCLDIKL